MAEFYEMTLDQFADFVSSLQEPKHGTSDNSCVLEKAASLWSACEADFPDVAEKFTSLVLTKSGNEMIVEAYNG